jgi:D-sedoheptulose 7-phosphate isomerase
MTFDPPAIRERIRRSAQVIASLDRQAERILAVTDQVRQCLAGGGKVLTCGNGGSAAEALHLAEELIGRYKHDRPPFAAVCLNADPTALTCIANDYGFEQVFARQVRALASPGDSLVVFSTSGASVNLVRALEAGRERRARTIGLLGRTGGECAPLCDLALIVECDQTEHIQEAHQVLLHLILEAVESA